MFWKNTKFSAIACAVLLAFCLGCGVVERFRTGSGEGQNSGVTNSNANLSDQALGAVVGEEKIGIAECDDAMAILVREANNPEDNFVVRAGKASLLNTFKSQIKRFLENNNTDRAMVADFCREFRKNLQPAGNTGTESW